MLLLSDGREDRRRLAANHLNVGAVIMLLCALRSDMTPEHATLCCGHGSVHVNATLYSTARYRCIICGQCKQDRED